MKSQKRRHEDQEVEEEEEHSIYPKNINNNNNNIDNNTKKEEPNYNQSGILAAETNSLNGITLKYHEPPEARLALKSQWRLYIFKDKKQIEMYKISRQTAHLIGRERLIVDIPTDHPSCSKQHAVIQFRQVNSPTSTISDITENVKPYLIDLKSANGTFINGKRISTSRFHELKSKDVLQFGTSSREYVIIKEE